MCSSGIKSAVRKERMETVEQRVCVIGLFDGTNKQFLIEYLVDHKKHCRYFVSSICEWELFFCH